MFRKLASSNSTRESQRLFELQLSGFKVILPHFHQRCHCPPDVNAFLCQYHTCFASCVFLIFHRTWATYTCSGNFFSVLKSSTLINWSWKELDINMHAPKIYLTKKELNTDTHTPTQTHIQNLRMPRCMLT